MRQVTFVFMLKVTNANDSLLIIKSGQDQLERKELNEREMKIRQSCRVRFRNQRNWHGGKVKPNTSTHVPDKNQLNSFSIYSAIDHFQELKHNFGIINICHILN